VYKDSFYFFSGTCLAGSWLFMGLDYAPSVLADVLSGFVQPLEAGVQYFEVAHDNIHIISNVLFCVVSYST
jgi:hypothetical protein